MGSGDARESAWCKFSPTALLAAPWRGYRLAASLASCLPSHIASVLGPTGVQLVLRELTRDQRRRGEVSVKLSATVKEAVADAKVEIPQEEAAAEAGPSTP